MALTTPLPNSVATLDDRTRGDFLVKVYQHLLGAVVAFVLFETLLFATGAAQGIYDFVAGSGVAWLLLLGAVILLNRFTAQAAFDLANPARQYVGLFGTAAGEALIFAPFLYYVFNVEGDGTVKVGAAAAITAIGFAGLTVVGLVTRKDLSFLRPIVMWGFLCALGLIVAAIVLGFELGVTFSLAMIALAGVAILYQTQNILRRFPEDAYVGAAVQLFASVMTMFWYVLRLFTRR
jgi:FtsH-binding integral membrane protein